jgi:hypothetical protein
MPEAALVAAQAYLLTTQPELGDPREHMHQVAIKSLGLVGDKLKQKIRRIEVNIPQAYRKKKPMIPISAKPKNQFTWQDRQ